MPISSVAAVSLQDPGFYSKVIEPSVYNIEHTDHHLASIKIGLATVAPEIKLPEHFGVAPSTILYRKGLCAQ